MYSWERSRFFTFTELPVGFLMIPANLSGMKKAHRWSPWQSWPWHGKDFTRNLVAWTTCLSKSLRNSTTQTMVIHSFYPWQTLSTTLDIRFHIIEKLGRSELENSVRIWSIFCTFSVNIWSKDTHLVHTWHFWCLSRKVATFYHIVFSFHCAKWRKISYSFSYLSRHCAQHTLRSLIFSNFSFVKKKKASWRKDFSIGL